MSSSGGGSGGGNDIFQSMKKASQRLASVVADTGAKTLLKVRQLYTNKAKRRSRDDDGDDTNGGILFLLGGWLGSKPFDTSCEGREKVVVWGKGVICFFERYCIMICCLAFLFSLTTCSHVHNQQHVAVVAVVNIISPSTHI